MTLKTKRVTVYGAPLAVALASNLVEQSTSYHYEPLPDDAHEFTVKAEALPRVLQLRDYLRGILE